MGGTDEPENLVELTPAEHAEAHRVLYEEHGHKEDWLAWQGLAGYTKKEDIIKEMVTVAAKKGGAANRENMIKNNPQRDPEIKKRRMETWQNSDHYEDDIERLRSMAGNMKGRHHKTKRTKEHADKIIAAREANGWVTGTKGKKRIFNEETGRYQYI